MPTDGSTARAAATLLGTLLLAAGCAHQGDGSTSGPSVAREAPGTAEGTMSIGPGHAASARGPGDAASSPAPREASGSASPSSYPEVPPAQPGAAQTVLSDLLPPLSSGPLLAGPLPEAGAASGRLVAGFPVLLRPVRATDVGTSSVSPSGSRLQVALTGTTSLSVDAVLRTYRIRMAARQLRERATPPAGGRRQVAAFSRGASSVTVSAQPEGARTGYVVYAVLHAPRG